jgi:TnpA family transposase
VINSPSGRMIFYVCSELPLFGVFSTRCPPSGLRSIWCGETKNEKLLKNHERQAVFGVPTDDDSLIRYYTLSPSDLLDIQIRRRPPNQLGFAVQLCLMRDPGRTLAPGENLPPDTLEFIARQLDIDPHEFHVYGRREPTRMEHVAFLLTYLGMRTATPEDRRVALSAAIEVAATTDTGSHSSVASL